MTSPNDAPPAPARDQFVRGIGPLAATSLVVGSMIGSGIFIVSADIGRQVASWGPGGLLLVWLLTGLMTMAGALAYAELAAMLPNVGGQYVFLREGLSPSAGFLYGWTLFTVIQTGTIAAVAVAFAKFLAVLVPSVTPDVFLKLGSLNLPGGTIELGLSNQRIVAVVMIAVLTAVNMRGVRLGAAIQTVFTVAKVGRAGGAHPARPLHLPAAGHLGDELRHVLGREAVGARDAAGGGRRHGGLALLERCVEQRDLRGRRGARAAEEPAAGAGVRHRPREPALHPRERGVPQRAAVRRPAERRRRVRAGHPVRVAGSRGHRGAGSDPRADRRHRDGDRDPRLHLRLQQRPHPRRAAGVLRDGARPPVLRARGHAAPDAPHADVRPAGAGGAGRWRSASPARTASCSTT